jgi:hypothetical protein
VGVASATVGLVLAACESTSPSSTPTTVSLPSSSSTTSPATTPTTTAPTPQAAANGPYWLLESSAVTALEQAGMTQAQVDSYFNSPRTFLILKNSDSDVGLTDATLVKSFASYAAMSQAFASGSIPAGVHYILYDNEHWSYTPANEQAAPITYAQDAETLVHQHGMRLIFTPAINLASSAPVAGVKGQAKFGAFVSQNLAGQAAQVSDVFELQAQQAVGMPDFSSFVSSAVGQARAANPSALILLGLSTNPVGRPITAQDLLDAYNATRSEVDGYWLNIPGSGGGHCPSCGTPQPAVAQQFLQMLTAQG